MGHRRLWEGLPEAGAERNQRGARAAKDVETMALLAAWGRAARAATGTALEEEVVVATMAAEAEAGALMARAEEAVPATQPPQMLFTRKGTKRETAGLSLRRLLLS
jgi:hypothetical protein